MPKREPSKCREWERERRERLKTCFDALGRLLPTHDPAVAPSKLEILQRAAAHITELQRKNKELVLGDTQIQNTAQRDEVRRLRDRVRKLSSRAEQLAGLLRAAGLRVPKECISGGIFRGPPRLWSGRVSKEKAEQLRTQHEQENDPKTTDSNTPEKTNKLKRKRVASPSKKTSNNSETGSLLTNSVTKKPAFSTRNTNNVKRPNVINRRRSTAQRSIVQINTTSDTSTTTNSSTSGVAARVAAVLGPGTLILANGSVVPVPPPRTTSTITSARVPPPATLHRIQLLPVTAPPAPVILMQSSCTNNNETISKLPNIQPKNISAKSNRPNIPRKVPIPVLRSNRSVLTKKRTIQQLKSTKTISVSKEKTLIVQDKSTIALAGDKNAVISSTPVTNIINEVKDNKLEQKLAKKDQNDTLQCLESKTEITSKPQKATEQIPFPENKETVSSNIPSNNKLKKDTENDKNNKNDIPITNGEISTKNMQPKILPLQEASLSLSTEIQTRKQNLIKTPELKKCGSSDKSEKVLIEQPKTYQLEKQLLSPLKQQVTQQHNLQQKLPQNHSQQKQIQNHLQQKSTINHLQQKPIQNHLQQKPTQNHLQQKPAQNNLQQKQTQNQLHQNQPHNNLQQKQSHSELQQRTEKNQLPHQQPNQTQIQEQQTLQNQLHQSQKDQLQHQSNQLHQSQKDQLQHQSNQLHQSQKDQLQHQSNQLTPEKHQQNQLQPIQQEKQLQPKHSSNNFSNQLQVEHEPSQVQTEQQQQNQLQQQNQTEEQQPQHPDEHHSELSNDIFASLQDGTGSGVMGSQHTESMSPTAAFLLAFPLVSTLTGSGRVTDPAHGSTNGDNRAVNGSSGGNGNNNSGSDDDGGRQGTPTTLLQIGGTITLDNNNKQNQLQTNEEVPRPLDNFAYFNARDTQQYSSVRDHNATSLEPISSHTCLYEQAQVSTSQATTLPNIGYNNETADTYNTNNNNNPFTELRNTGVEHQQQSNQIHQSVYTSCLAKEKTNSKQRINKNQQQQYRAPVNWMTSPDVRPTYTHQHYQHASTTSSLATSDYFLPPFSDVYGSNNGNLDHNTATEHPPFTWSPTAARSTLPTLIGDLALGVTTSNNLSQHLDQQQHMEQQSKDTANSTTPFLSVSSLVNGNKQQRNKQTTQQQSKRHREKNNKTRSNNSNTNNSTTTSNTSTSSTNTLANNAAGISTSYINNNVHSNTKRTDNSSYITSVSSNIKRSENQPYIDNNIKRIENPLYIDNNVNNNNNHKRSDNSSYNNVNNTKRSSNVLAPYMDSSTNSNIKRSENTSYIDNNINNTSKRSIVGGYSAEALIGGDNTNNMHNHHLQQQSIYSSYEHRNNNYTLPSSIVDSANGCRLEPIQHNVNQQHYQQHQSNQQQIQSNHLQQQQSQHQHHRNNIQSSSTHQTNSQHRQTHSHNNQTNNNIHSHNQSSTHHQHIAPSTSFSHITTPSTSSFSHMIPSSTFSHIAPTTSNSFSHMSSASSFPHISSCTSTFSHMSSTVTTSSSFSHMTPSSFSHHPPPLGGPPGEFSALLSAAVVDTYNKTFDTLVHVKPPVPPPPLVSATLAMSTVTSSITTATNFDSYCGSHRNDVITGTSHNTRPHISTNGDNERRRHSNSRRNGNNSNQINTSTTGGGFVDLSFLTMPSAVSSPLLPDDFHTPTPFLSNTAPPVPIPPPIPPTGSSLTNFNLSAIFPEINKGTPSIPISTWSSSSKTSTSSSRSQSRYHHQNQLNHQNHSQSHSQQQHRNSNHSGHTNSVNTSGYRHHQHHQQFSTDSMYVSSGNSTTTNIGGGPFSSMLPHHQVQPFNSTSTSGGISTSVPGNAAEVSTTPLPAAFSFSFTTP